MKMKIWRSEGHAGGWFLTAAAVAAVLKFAPTLASTTTTNIPYFWGLYWCAAITISRLLARRGSAEALVKRSNLKGKIAIVTGANRGGIGFYTAMKLAETGCKVVLTCRSEKLCKATAIELQQESSAGGCTIPLDLVDDMTLTLDDFDSVRAFVAEFQRRFDRLDILVNNAGMASSADPHYSSFYPKYEIHTAANFMG